MSAPSGTLFGMEFTLHSDNGETQEHFRGDARYRFNQAGLLVITNGEGQTFTYSPHAWSKIEEATRAPKRRTARRIH